MRTPSFASFMRAILVTHFVWPFCHTMFTPFVRAKFQRSSPAVAYARRGEKNPFATPRRADPPPSPTLQRIWTPLDTCGHPLSKSYSRVSYIILSSYLYFWTLWILLCRYFVRRRRKLFYENVFWKTRSTFPKWVRGVQNTTPHDKTIHETRELRLDTPCPPTDTGSMPQHTRARAREKKHSASWVVR